MQQVSISSEETSLPAAQDKKALLAHGQLDLLFSAVPNSVLANVLGSLLVFIIDDGRIPDLRIYCWISLLLLITAARFLHYQRYKAAAPGPQDITDWYMQFRLGSLILAGVVGSAGFLLFDYNDPTYQLVLALMMTCVASFAITTMSPSRELVIAFLLLLLGPLTGSLFLTHALNDSRVVWMMPATLAMLLLSCIRISRNIERNIILTIEAQQHEKDMQNFQQRLALFFHETPLAVLEWGHYGNVLQWNPAAEQLFGYTHMEAEGEKLTMLVASMRSLRRLETLWDEMAQSRNSTQFVMENRMKDGTLRLCEWFSTPLIDSLGRVIGIISLVQDVTQREENDRIKQEFVSIVSHELRTPVTAIKGSLGLLTSGMMDDEPEKMREIQQVALENTDRLHLLINDILDVDKLESGRMDYRYVESDLGELVQRVVTANESLAHQAAVSLTFMPGPDPVVVNMDPDRIFQVLTNILANAIKFAHTGSNIIVSLTTEEDRVKVAVNNFGEVITEADREKLFTKFFQRDSSTTRAKGGTGLGLYICQKILQSHQSRLDFMSSVNAGTTFFFYLALHGTVTGRRRHAG